MGGVAALARAAGHEVTGCDRNVYPPMSTQLRKLGIDIHEGVDADQLEINPDCVVVGNVMSRGVEVVEAMLDRGMPYKSGPQWLAENVLHDRHVMAVAGTHGKTTTASEYDTAFFDKRAKFVHYRPRTVILNNLEYDHADIYKDMDAILWQFHQLLRTVPGSGRIVMNGDDENLRQLIEQGCWTPLETFSTADDTDWTARFGDKVERHIGIRGPDGKGADTRWKIGGVHNLENALAAVAAAASAGVSLEQAVDAM
jgi:UDP-N-acetylmuramate: L-alanyl-gamma-D-glutamyl-meso-diaminopimelate ligase